MDRLTEYMESLVQLYLGNFQEIRDEMEVVSL